MEKKEKKLKSGEPWYDIDNDRGNPEYKWDDQLKEWLPTTNFSYTSFTLLWCTISHTISHSSLQVAS